MKGHWQKERPEWAVFGVRAWVINAFEELKVVEVDIDSIFFDGLGSKTECLGVELWWSEPIEVPPMPEEER